MSRNKLMLFVADVSSAARFYESAFEAQRDHVDEDGSYAEVKVGDLVIGFVANWHAEKHLGIPFQPSSPVRPPAGFDLYLEVPDADASFERALQAGASVVAGPDDKPWGWRVGYLRDLDGVVIEVASKLR